jgi:hypothetical protein
VDYDLNRLGEREFEHLTQALMLRVLGSGVEVFGDGPDGGREATFEGGMSFPQPDSQAPWNGYWVVQAKFHYRPRDAAEGAGWLKEQLRNEFSRWLDESSRRGRFPEYFLAATNVVLSPYPEVGGIDSVNKMIAEYAPRLGLKGWQVWGYDKLCRLLDINSDIARRYYGLITPGDVLAQMQDYLWGSTGNLGDVLRAHVVRELRADHLVHLDQAGARDDQGLALPKVAVDLPAQLANGDDVLVTAYVIEHGDRVLRPSAGAQMSRLVILGGPGQGKTTLAQMICQTYRVALLADVPEHGLTHGVRSLLDEFRGSLLGILGISLPAVRRWPTHVRLDQYADAISRDPDLTLLRYIANQVNKRAERVITAGHLIDWLERWPWLVVLDGLDEVADQRTRDELLQHMTEFQDTAVEHDADLLLVATTRPQGYADEFDPSCSEYLTLRPLKEPEALQYAERLAAARHADDLDKQEEVIERVQGAVREERTARLMHSPLQVTIMSLLLERRQAAPHHRYELFKGYYDVVLAREQAKKTADAQLLERYAGHVEALQEAVGLLLQKRSERQGDAEASLPENELRALAESLLKAEQYDPDAAHDLAGKLVTTALNRLVLLVPLPGSGIRFEVRSLQEFMAARALVSGPDLQIVANLQAVVPSAHWRNTWLLAAGRLFSERSHIRGELLIAMRSCDTADTLSMAVIPAAHLAIELLEEGIAETSPGHEIVLVQHALDLLRKPPDFYLVRLAEVLAGVMRRNPQAATAAGTAIAEASASAGQAALSAVIVSAVWANGTGAAAGRARRWLADGKAVFPATDPRRRSALASLQATYPLPQLRDPPSPGTGAFEPVEMAPILELSLTAQDLAPAIREQVGEVITVIAETRLMRDRTGDVPVTKVDRGYLPDLSRLDRLLEDPWVSKAIVRTAETLDLADWPVATLLRRVMALWLQRQPVARRLLTPNLSDLES